VSEIAPFELAVDDADLDDLRSRLRRTRWPDKETAEGWTQGIPLDYMKRLCRHWAEDYDWRRVERRLNELGQSATVIDDVVIHFLHVRSPHPGAMPLVLTHGWPGSVVEFLEVIGPLSDPPRYGASAADAFDVVCPSLPGYGFSGKPAQAGWGIARIAAAWVQLMARLGYERYGAQGGDWGAMVTTKLAELDRERIAGIHVNMPLVSPDDIAAEGPPTEAEQAALASFARYRSEGSGYAKEQSTRPQTIGYGLADSPAAQCAWIVEKFSEWSDADGDPDAAFGRDRLLDNVMLYWLPAAGASSARLYWESFYDRDLVGPVEVPSGVSRFPKEIFPASRRWVQRRFRDLRHYNALPRGGHFAAFEEPELFVDEVRRFFRHVR
jgi:pimeloyl-ACP methyl ester carboxylesterase